jgi:hypothetical protein
MSHLSVSPLRSQGTKLSEGYGNKNGMSDINTKEMKEIQPRKENERN